MSKKKKPDKRGMVNNLKTLQLERTRVIGDLLTISDSSESYYALSKRLDDLNSAIDTITKDLQRMGAGV